MAYLPKVGLYAALILGAFSLVVPAEARMCDSRENVTKLLEDRYKETPVAVGLVSDRGVMEMYVSAESGTWSVVMTTPQGKACVIAAGQNYEAVEVKLLGPAA